MNKDLDKIRGWAEQWKMTFNPDPTKQTQEVIFSKKTSESFHPKLYFNKFVVEKNANPNAFRAKVRRRTS